MKLAILHTFLFIIANVKIPKCFADGTKYLKGVHLNTDEPLQVNDVYTELVIEEARGSIGIKTFSQVPQLVTLQIEESTIDQVEDGALCSLPNLKKLVLSKPYKFPVLTSSLFSGCDKLKTLQLRRVQVQSDALKHMTNLDSLSIAFQNISSLTKEFLEPLKSLTNLNFLRCKIDQIDIGSICLSPKLNVLSLLDINVATPLAKGVFETCNTVTDFSYTYSKETSIQEEVFTGLINVRRAYLNELSISTLTKGYLSGLSNVEKLTITDSSFTKVTSDAFQGFDNLKLLQLSFGKISELESGAFSLLPKLVYLNLSYNNLTSIDGINNTNVKGLYVVHNKITKIDAEALRRNLPNLEDLVLFGNTVSPEDKAEIEKTLQGKIHFEETVSHDELLDKYDS